MEFIASAKPEKVTVRQLITLLIEQEMDGEIIIRDSLGNRLSNASLCVVKEQSHLGCLFG